MSKGPVKAAKPRPQAVLGDGHLEMVGGALSQLRSAPSTKSETLWWHRSLLLARPPCDAEASARLEARG